MTRARRSRALGRWVRSLRGGALWCALIGAASASGCAALFGARPLTTAGPGRTTLHVLPVAGRTRHYLLHLPPAAAAGPVPLVLAFHGDGANAAIFRESSRLDAAADRFGIAVAYPDGSGALDWFALSWHVDGECCGWALAHDVDDVEYAEALVRALGRVPGVDTTRVAAVGFSAGGTLALRLACERADLVRAAVNVAGAMPHLPCTPGRPVSVLLVQGATDDELRDEQLALQLRHAPRRTHSLENALRFWARQAGCTADAIRRDSTARQVVERAQGCPGVQAVELHTIGGHPHAWPGGRRPWVFAPRPAPEVDGAALVMGFVRRVLVGHASHGTRAAPSR